MKIPYFIFLFCLIVIGSSLVSADVSIGSSKSADVIIHSPSTSGGGGNATNFTDLLDVPNSYLGAAGECVAVKATEDGLEFVPCGTGGSVGIDGLSIINTSGYLEVNRTWLNITIENLGNNLYLRLDTSNDPLTGHLHINNSLSVDNGNVSFTGSNTEEKFLWIFNKSALRQGSDPTNLWNVLSDIGEYSAVIASTASNAKQNGASVISSVGGIADGSLSSIIASAGVTTSAGYSSVISSVDSEIQASYSSLIASKDGFIGGTAMQSSMIACTNCTLAGANSLVAGMNMKPSYITPINDLFIFGHSDTPVDFASVVNKSFIIYGDNLYLMNNSGTNCSSLMTDEDGLVRCGPGGGGEGTPAPPNTSIQFNDGGSFGGSSNFTFNKTNNKITISKGNIWINDYYDFNDTRATGALELGENKEGFIGMNMYAGNSRMEFDSISGMFIFSNGEMGTQTLRIPRNRLLGEAGENFVIQGGGSNTEEGDLNGGGIILKSGETVGKGLSNGFEFSMPYLSNVSSTIGNTFYSPVLINQFYTAFILDDEGIGSTSFLIQGTSAQKYLEVDTLNSKINFLADMVTMDKAGDQMYVDANIVTSENVTAECYEFGDGTVQCTTGIPALPNKPALPNNSVQYNNAGAFGGSSNLTFDGKDLTMGGNLYLVNDSSNAGIIYKGTQIFIHDKKASGTVGSNTFVGVDSGNLNFIGASSGSQASYNTGIGKESLMGLTTGDSNTAVGYGALYLTHDGLKNSALGMSTLNANTAGGYNSAFGADSLKSETTGISNTALGYQTGTTLTTGGYNTIIGGSALYSELNGSYNTAVGQNAFYSQSGSSNNVGLGAYAGYYETGSNTLFIDNQDRTNETISRTNSMFYGQFNSTVASQILTINTGTLNLKNNVSMSSTGLVIFNGLNSQSRYNGNAQIVFDTQNTNSPWRILNIGTNQGTLSFYKGTYSASNLYFGLDANGNGAFGAKLAVGGNFIPQIKLHINSTADENILRLQDSDGTCDMNPESTAITTTCTSDERLKRDIKDADINIIWNKYLPIKIKDYEIISSGERAVGVIAQELQLTNPKMVHNITEDIFKYGIDATGAIDYENKTKVGETMLLTVEQPNEWEMLKMIQDLKKDNVLMKAELCRLGNVKFCEVGI